jgi:hypothetical protein
MYLHKPFYTAQNRTQFHIYARPMKFSNDPVILPSESCPPGDLLKWIPGSDLPGVRVEPTYLAGTAVRYTEMSIRQHSDTEKAICEDGNRRCSARQIVSRNTPNRHVSESAFEFQ